MTGRARRNGWEEGDGVPFRRVAGFDDRVFYAGSPTFGRTVSTID